MISQHENNVPSHCPECAAQQVDGMTCWEQLGTILAWEYSDPALAAQHFLTVAAYNLQHPAQFTDEGEAGLRTAFIDHLDTHIAVTEILRRGAANYAGKKRVLKPEAERHPVLRQWTMTIADVYLGDQPQGAAERVRTWAAAIRSEMDADHTSR